MAEGKNEPLVIMKSHPCDDIGYVPFFVVRFWLCSRPIIPSPHKLEPGAGAGSQLANLLRTILLFHELKSQVIVT